MKNNRTIAIAASLLLAFTITVPVALTPGCAWVRRHPQAPGEIARQAAATVAREVVLAHPETRAKFVAAQEKLRALQALPLVTVQDLINIISLLPPQYLQTQTARIAVDGVRLIIVFSGNVELPMETTVQVKAIAGNLDIGITEGLAQAPQ